eukprot:365747-Chlamydomonas_euryale.AAC.22
MRARARLPLLDARLASTLSSTPLLESSAAASMARLAMGDDTSGSPCRMACCMAACTACCTAACIAACTLRGPLLLSFPPPPPAVACAAASPAAAAPLRAAASGSPAPATPAALAAAARRSSALAEAYRGRGSLIGVMAGSGSTASSPPPSSRSNGFGPGSAVHAVHARRALAAWQAVARQPPSPCCLRRRALLCGSGK